MAVALNVLYHSVDTSSIRFSIKCKTLLAPTYPPGRRFRKLFNTRLIYHMSAAGDQRARINGARWKLDLDS